MLEATAAEPGRPFQAPPGISLVAVDPTTGRPAQGEEGAIQEAFLAGEEPIWSDPLEVPGAMGPRPPAPEAGLAPRPIALAGRSADPFAGPFAVPGAGR